jgi:diguanylate cyclase (GGDEF)-like protein
MSESSSSFADEPSLLKQIDAALQGQSLLLRFENALEPLFGDHRHRRHLRSMQVAGLMMSLVMCSFLLVDYTLTPDVFSLAMRLRTGFIMGLLLLGLFTFKRLQSHATAELQALSISLLATGVNLYLVAQSDSPLRPLHLLSTAMVILYNNVILRPKFQGAALVTSLMFAGLAWTGIRLPDGASELRVLLPVLLASLATATCSLYFLYRLEIEERHNFLMSLRHGLLTTRLAKVNGELHQLARLDALTQVANRRQADEHLAQLWQRASHDQGWLAVLMIDIDHFKAYNDRYGHPAGDACLRAVAQALQLSLRRSGDLLARYGGEEFIAVIHGVPPEEALQTAARVVQAVRDLNRLHEKSPSQQVTISAGLHCARTGDTRASVQDWIEAADRALYEAKRSGRNQVCQTGWPHGEVAA